VGSHVAPRNITIRPTARERTERRTRRRSSPYTESHWKPHRGSPIANRMQHKLPKTHSWLIVNTFTTPRGGNLRQKITPCFLACPCIVWSCMFHRIPTSATNASISSFHSQCNQRIDVAISLPLCRSRERPNSADLGQRTPFKEPTTNSHELDVRPLQCDTPKITLDRTPALRRLLLDIVERKAPSQRPTTCAFWRRERSHFCLDALQDRVMFDEPVKRSSSQFWIVVCCVCSIQRGFDTSPLGRWLPVHRLNLFRARLERMQKGG
jgi:hypothetical protein